MSRLSRFYPTHPVDLGARLNSLPDDGSVPFLPGWRWVHTPGHSVGHVAFWRADDRLLVSGDAVISTGQESAYEVAVQEPELHGPPMYLTVDWQAAAASVRRLAGLGPEILVTSHGRPLEGAEMRAALDRLADGFEAIAVPGQGRYVETPRRAEDGSAYERP
jgi:glyoxylase-like metal-dependent hydrolase (beta-lactamase superfamily II)